MYLNIDPDCFYACDYEICSRYVTYIYMYAISDIETLDCDVIFS